MASQRDIIAGTHGRCAYCLKILTLVKGGKSLRKHICFRGTSSHGKIYK